MIHLPLLTERVWLRSFWVAICLLGATLAVSLGWFFDGEVGWSASAVVGTLFAGGMMVPHLLVWPLRGWNKAARLYAGYAEALVLRISFLTVCVPAGWAGSQIRVAPPPSKGTLWLSRQRQKPVEQPFPNRDSSKKRAESWIARYIMWAWESGETWRVALLPFLLLLSALQSTEQKTTVPDNIYTLY